MMIEDVSKSEQEFVLSYPDTNILGSSTTEINGFPASEISYVQGLVSEYEFDQEKFHTMQYVIIAYDREYRIKYQAADQNEFDKYSSIVEEIANSLKINKPAFEGVKC